ncbi:MAG TPA: hypothetical protein PKA58_15580 [Polyangium sp.]|jgi:hypothetical protein|nr:hypothetical protein [Polyangium sp.]
MSSSNATGNPALDNPGVTATLFAIVVFCGFVGALYNAATSHHGGGDHAQPHGGQHQSAPAAH